MSQRRRLVSHIDSRSVVDGYFVNFSYMEKIMKINQNLCRALAQCGFDYEDVGIFAGVYGNIIVRLIQCDFIPDPDLKQTLADILDKSVEELWPE